MAARARENARADGIVHWVFISACLGLDDPYFTSSTSMTKILSISQDLGMSARVAWKPRVRVSSTFPGLVLLSSGVETS